MYKYLKTLAIIAVIFFISELTYADFQFTHDLKQSDSSLDVKTLQQILNYDPETQVAIAGPGSPENETLFFGTLTKNAVIRFQNKYQSEVLIPVGLKSGTGFVGLMTRKKLNEIVSKTTIPAQFLLPSSTTPQGQNLPNPTQNGSAASSASEPPIIKSFSEDNVIPGQVFEIYGSGFSQESNVYVSDTNDLKINGVEYVNSRLLRVAVPNKNSMGMGIHLVYIQNAKGDTRWWSPAFIMVTENKIDSNSENEIKNAFKTMEEQNKLTSDNFQNNSTTPTSKNEDKNKGLAGFFLEIENIIKKLFYSEVSAQISNPMHNYFGGSINSVVYCTCYYNFGIILKIKDLSMMNQEIKTVYKPPFSSLRANYNIWYAGPNVIGGSIQMNFQCENTAGYYCEDANDSADSMIDFIRGVGSSLESSNSPKP